MPSVLLLLPLIYIHISPHIAATNNPLALLNNSASTQAACQHKCQTEITSIKLIDQESTKQTTLLPLGIW